MADGHLPGHGIQDALAKHIVDQPDVLVALDDAAVVDRNAAGLLPAVLQCEQRGVGFMSRAEVHALRDIDTKYAAFLVDSIAVKRGAGQFFHRIFHGFTSTWCAGRPPKPGNGAWGLGYSI